MDTTYNPAKDVSKELNSDRLQAYQEMIGILRWAVQISRIYILLEVSLLSSHLASSRVGHLLAVYWIFGYLNQVPKCRLFFDTQKSMISKDRFRKFDLEDFYSDAQEKILLYMPKTRGNLVSTNCFVEVSHAGDKVTRRLMTRILMFVNRAPIIWHSKSQNCVETSMFGSEFTAMNNAVELVAALLYKLRMFGVPMDVPTDIFPQYLLQH